MCANLKVVEDNNNNNNCCFLVLSFFPFFWLRQFKHVLLLTICGRNGAVDPGRQDQDHFPSISIHSGRMLGSFPVHVTPTRWMFRYGIQLVSFDSLRSYNISRLSFQSLLFTSAAAAVCVCVSSTSASFAAVAHTQAHSTTNTKASLYSIVSALLHNCRQHPMLLFVRSTGERKEIILS